jgi:hypothetical protein
MTTKLKNDIKTIVEVVAFLIIQFGISSIKYSSWIIFPFWALSVGAYIYYYFTVKKRKDIIIFPTQNDEASKMGFISFGIIIMVIPVVSYFVAALHVGFVIIGI